MITNTITVISKVNSILNTASAALETGQLQRAKKKYTSFKKPQQLEIVLEIIDTQCGIRTAIDKFILKYPGLSESSVRRWYNEYLEVRNKYLKQGMTEEVANTQAQADYLKELKRGAPLLLGEIQHQTLLVILCAMRKAGSKLNPSIVRGIAIGVMTDAGRQSELKSNGGGLELSRDWARKVLSYHLQWTKRKATTDRKLTADELTKAATAYQDINTKMKEYHPALVIELDETLAPYCPTDGFTYALEGDKRVQIIAQNDKRGETITLLITQNNELLPFQIIWAGLTKRSIPKEKWPAGFVNCYAGITGTRISKAGKKSAKTNKWQNVKTFGELIDLLIKPYLAFCRTDPIIKEELKNYSKAETALLISDHHWSHLDDSITASLRSINCDTQHIFAGSTDLFCALDVGLCKPLKSFFRTKFEEYCSTSVVTQLQKNIPPSSVKVDLHLSTLKPLAASWMSSCFKYMQGIEEELIKNAWEQVRKNTENNLGNGTTLPPQNLCSKTKCVARFLQSLQPNTNNKDTPVNNNNSNTNKKNNTDTNNSGTNKESNSNNDNENNNNDKENNNNDKENNNKENNDEENNITDEDNRNNDQEKILLGSIINVFWDDADGQRWETGTVKEHYRNTRTQFIVRYNFLLEAQKTDPDDEIEPDVIETLLGEKKVTWKYVTKAK